LEAARERRRFQETIEQLDEAHRQNTSAGTVEQDDLALLKNVWEESERTFGVSFSSLLHFISDHLLTRSERSVQDMLHAVHNDHKIKDVNYNPGDVTPPLQEERTITLMQTAKDATARTGLLGHVSAALTTAIAPNRALSSDSTALSQLYQRVTRDMTNPWFVTDPQGRCIYVNPAAEVFCGIRLDLYNLGKLDSLIPKTSSLTLLEAFAELLPRIRNVDEVLEYLQKFTCIDLDTNGEELLGCNQIAALIDSLPTNTLHCVIAAEPVLWRSPKWFEKGTRDREPDSFKTPPAKAPRNRFSRHQVMLLDSAPSDSHYQLMRYALYDPDGQLLANALQIQDITEQVRDEKNKSVLLSTVSHDLRTPLTTIKAAVTGLLQPGVVWDEQVRREVLEDIDAEADHLYNLVNSLIEMSRIDMGALVLEKEWCDLVEIVHSTLARAQRILIGHPVRTNFQPQLPLVQVDYVQLERVLHNLIENAVRYSPENAEIVIEIDSIAGQNLGINLPTGSHHFLRVQIIDHGDGVPEEERERIFKPFYSLDSQGSGLGLAICRGIIEAHQGRIWVEPASDGGSCFIIVLPISS
jgi:signal transduction histidine kinase